ncbi:uncharacterized protein V6R79_005122 [Siganus canaliculatus]
MSRHLLLLVPVLVLVLGVVDSQRTNMTEEEPGRVALNQTFSPFHSFNASDHSVNATSSWNQDQMRHIEEELHNNQTSVVTEDDESFQDQVMVQHCDRPMMDYYCQVLCQEPFHSQMMLIPAEDWCVLKKVIRPYDELSECLEEVSGLIGCYYPNPSTQDIFLDVHSHYFHDCSPEIDDAPHGVVMALTIVPVCLIPVLVYLVARPPVTTK